jgi:geranylgeranyl diphosphate synthase type I
MIRDVLGESTLGDAYYRRLSQAVAHSGKGRADGLVDIAMLPSLTCQAGGGKFEAAMPVTDAWQMVRLAAKLLDDVEDGEAKDAPAETINLATGLLFAAPLVLRGLLEQGFSGERILCLEEALLRAELYACAGQHSDLASGQSDIASMDPDTWLEIAQAKSGSLLGWATWAGALVAGADERALSGYHAYGCHLGVLLQVADDFKGVWSPGGVCDLAAGRPNLPVCYALHVAGEKERVHLETLLGQTVRGDRRAEAQAQQILIDLGAQGYTLVAARVQHQLAVTALQRAGCIAPTDKNLVAILDRTIPALELVSESYVAIETNAQEHTAPESP